MVVEVIDKLHISLQTGGNLGVQGLKAIAGCLFSKQGVELFDRAREIDEVAALAEGAVAQLLHSSTWFPPRSMNGPPSSAGFFTAAWCVSGDSM